MLGKKESRTTRDENKVSLKITKIIPKKTAYKENQTIGQTKSLAPSTLIALSIENQERKEKTSTKKERTWAAGFLGILFF